MAVSGGVWRYVNPDLATQVPEPTHAVAPTPAEASSIAGYIAFATLSPDERGFSS